MTIDLRPVTAIIGAEISGVDPSEPLSDEDVAAIRQACLNHLVLFFRDQHVDDDQHLAFALPSRRHCKKLDGSGHLLKRGEDVAEDEAVERPRRFRCRSASRSRAHPIGTCGTRRVRSWWYAVGSSARS